MPICYEPVSYTHLDVYKRQQMPTPLPQKTWQKIGERMQTELDLLFPAGGGGKPAQVVLEQGKFRGDVYKRQAHCY